MPEVLADHHPASVPVGRDHRYVDRVRQRRGADGERDQRPGRTPPQYRRRGQREDRDQRRLVLGQHRDPEQQARADRPRPGPGRRRAADERDQHQVAEQHPEHHRRLEQHPVVLPDAERVQGEQRPGQQAGPQRADPGGQLDQHDRGGPGQHGVEHAHLVDPRHQAGRLPGQPRPAALQVEEGGPVQEEHHAEEPREPAGDDAAAQVGVDDLVAEQVERRAVQRDPDGQRPHADRRREQRQDRARRDRPVPRPVPRPAGRSGGGLRRGPQLDLVHLPDDLLGPDRLSSFRARAR